MNVQMTPCVQTYIDFHLLVQPIVHDQTVGHSNPVRFHRMACNIGVVAHVGIVKVRHGLLFGACRRRGQHIYGGKGRHG